MNKLTPEQKNEIKETIKDAIKEEQDAFYSTYRAAILALVNNHVLDWDEATEVATEAINENYDWLKPIYDEYDKRYIQQEKEKMQ